MMNQTYTVLWDIIFICFKKNINIEYYALKIITSRFSSL